MENPKEDSWKTGYECGQRKLARTILESKVESVADLAWWLAKFKAIADGDELI